MRQRRTDLLDVRPDLREAEPLAEGLHFPTSLAFDDAGGIYVAESGLAFGEPPQAAGSGVSGPMVNAPWWQRALLPR